MNRFLATIVFALGLASGLAQAAEPAARTLVLVRHGHYLPVQDADPKLGPPLSDHGLMQARRVGERLPEFGSFDALYVSPLQRAHDTAAQIAGSFPGREFTMLPDLEECTPPTHVARIMAGEKVEDLAACRAQLDRLFTTYFRPAEGKPRQELFVCHGNVIRYLVVRALGVDERSWLSMSVGHASITRIRVEADGSFKVLSVGDVGHIPADARSGATGDPEPAVPAAANRRP